MSAHNDVFTINQIHHQDNSINALLGVDPESDILKGHFPGHPVVPGACMVQIVKEVLESALNTTLRLKKADQLKFMCLIDPTVLNGDVQLEIDYRLGEDSTVYVAGKLSDRETVCFKLQGTFVKA
jgi:3-hydroxyacyl-[acyl-carrier-protein] dehydratase